MEQRDMALPGPDGVDEVDAAAFRAAVEQVLDDHWVSEGFAAPNGATYPWLWLCLRATLT